MKTIDRILLALAGAAALVCAVFGYQYLAFPTTAYACTAAPLRREAEELRTESDALAKQLAELEARREEASAALAQAQERAAFAENARENMLALRKEYAGKIRQLEDMVLAGETDVKICYWTLDDGPTYITEDFLDAIRELGIYVTFFTSREANPQSDEKPLLRREIMEGHAIGNHTNSHQYRNLYQMGLDSFFEQVDLQDQWLQDCTGIKPDIFRFPGGSGWAFSTLPRDAAIAGLEERGYVWIDWSCDLFDNGVANPSAYKAYTTAVSQIKTLDIAVILSHDWNINTLEAMKMAVPELQEAGYVFLPLFSDSWTFGNTRILFG